MNRNNFTVLMAIMHTTKTATKIFLILFVPLFLFSCNEAEKPKNDFTTDNYIQTFGKRIKTNIGATGFTIDLPQTHKMEERKGADFTVYYITSIDTTYNKGGAGIYFGKNPDQHAPESMVSKTEAPGTLFGKNANTVEYITPSYTWDETVVDMGDGNKIQIWYFAPNAVELFNLHQMTNTISPKAQ